VREKHAGVRGLGDHAYIGEVTAARLEDLQMQFGVVSFSSKKRAKSLKWSLP
jgi:hypothetical protein